MGGGEKGNHLMFKNQMSECEIFVPVDLAFHFMPAGNKYHYSSFDSGLLLEALI